LIIFSGGSGVGKTTIGSEVARRLGAVYIRIDSIENALRTEATTDIRDQGYRVGYAVAADNLRLGMTVVADSVNPWPITREAWHESARQAGVRWLDVEVSCSDPTEHRRRVAQRETDIPGHVPPTWDEVVARDYRAWDSPAPLLIDTATASVEQAVERVVHAARLSA